MSHEATVAERFERSDDTLRDWERRLNQAEEPDVAETTEVAIEVVKDLITAYLQILGRDWEGADDDILALWKVSVKKNPSLNTIRDNCRELVYYHNCVDMDRRDALPQNAHRQAIRTARHVYVYLRTRAEETGELEKASLTD
ncbi:hypothetical protein [Thiohalorhabdus sp.]|uniref:hypothetical protein n=1 Tax=Thiohalorhabdus sp. TaxID=3094134 RepID=UPI002FC37F99